MKRFNFQKGMSLVEILIALGVSSIVMLAVVSLMQTLSKANRVTIETSERSDIDNTIQNIIGKTADICGNAFQHRPTDGSADPATSDRYVSLGALTTTSATITDYSTLVEGVTKTTVNTIVWNKDRFPFNPPVATANDDLILYKIGEPTYKNSALKIKDIIITKISADADIKINSKNFPSSGPEAYKRALFQVHLFLEKIVPDSSIGSKTFKVTTFNMAGIWKATDAAAKLEYCYSEQSPTYFCKDFMDGTLLDETFSPRCLLSRFVSANTVNDPYTEGGLKFQVYSSPTNINAETASEVAIIPSASQPLANYASLPTKMYIHSDGNIGIGMSITNPGILSSGSAVVPAPKVHIKGDLLVEGSILTTNRLSLKMLNGPYMYSNGTSIIQFPGVDDKNIVFCALSNYVIWGKSINSSCQIYTTDADNNGVLEWYITVASASRSAAGCTASCLVQEQLGANGSYTTTSSQPLPTGVPPGGTTTQLYKCPVISEDTTILKSQCVGQITDNQTCETKTFGMVATQNNCTPFSL